MINILFDHQKFSSQRFGGISKYFSYIIDYLKSTEDIDYHLGVLYSDNEYINENNFLFKNELLKSMMRSKYDKRKYKLNEVYSNYLLRSGQYDVFHPTYYDPYFLKSLKKPFVLTVHDMTHEKLPEYFWPNDSLTSDKRICVEHANQLIAISETTKQDMLELYDLDPNRIEVIHHGIDLSRPFSVKAIDNLPKDFVLFIGDRSGYKNFYMLLNAFAKIHKKHPDLKVVLVGGGTLKTAELEFINRLRIADKVEHMHVSDEELNYVYSAATLFVYPSLYEGFGLPVLEGFRAKCPMLLSDIPSFREVASDTAFYFEPYQLDSLISMLEKLLDDEIYRKSLTEKAYSRLGLFDLGNSLQKTCEVYRSLA